MIREVHIKNWKSHGEINGNYGSSLSFERGLNVIYGVNGSGKSSIAEAIHFALFGKRGDDVIRRGAKKAEVKVVLETDNVYIIKRSLGRGGSDDVVVMTEDGKLLSVSKQRDANKTVEDILGVNAKLFEKAVYGEQNKMLEFYESSPKERAKMIDDIMGMKEFFEAKEVITRIYNRLLDEIRQKGDKLTDYKKEEEELKTSISKEEEKVSSLRERVMELTSMVESLSSSEEKLKKELSELEVNLRSLEEKREKYITLSAQVKRLKEEIKWPDASEKDEDMLQELLSKMEKKKSLEGTINHLKSRRERILKELESIPEAEEVDMERLKKELEEKEYILREIEDKHNGIRKELYSLEINISSLKEELKHLLMKEEEYKRLSSEVNELPFLKDRLESLTENLEELRSVEEELKSRISVLKQSHLLKEGRCPLCGRSIDKVHAEEIIAHREEELKKLQNELEAVLAKRKVMEREYNDVHRRVLALEVKQDRLKDLKDQLSNKEDIKRKIEESDRRLKELGEMLSRIEEEKSRISSLVEALRKRLSDAINTLNIINRKRSLQQELLEVEKEIEKTEHSLKELGDIDAQTIERYRERVESYRKKLQLEALEKQLSSLQWDEREYNNMKSRVEAVRKEFLELVSKKKELEGTLKGLQETLREKEKLLEEMKRRLAILEDELRDYERLKTIRDSLELVRRAWEESIKEVRKRRVDLINKTVKLVWNAVYRSQYSDYKDISFSMESARSGYTYSLKVKGDEWYDVDVLSGGERMLALLALRIAMAYLLSKKSGFLILDEPTHNLDENISRKLAEFLHNTTQEGLFDQIILITHDPVFSEYADVVYRMERAKTGNDPTTVVRER